MRIAVISDVHANLLALEAVLGDIARRGADLTVDLGDRVAGPLWPRETLERLAAIPGVRGNHDRWIAERDLDALGPWDVLARHEIDAAGRAALLALPGTLDIAPGVLAFHACPDADEEALLERPEGGRLAMIAPAKVAARIGAVSARLLLCGHSHVARVMHLPDGRMIVNPGSVGCPAYRNPNPPAHVYESGAPHARYALIELAGGEIVVDLVSVPYDWEAAARRAEANGHPDWVVPLTTGTMG